jgi:hypothetical protein
VRPTGGAGSGAAGDFAPLVGVSKHTRYARNRKFQVHGPAARPTPRSRASPTARAGCPAVPPGLVFRLLTLRGTPNSLI